MREVALGDLGFDEGGHLLVKRALRAVGAGGGAGHGAGSRGPPERLVPRRGPRFRGQAATTRRFAAAKRRPARGRVPSAPGGEPNRWSTPPRSWGLAARGARVEAGAPEFDFTLVDKIEVWSADAARIYAQAAAAQWDPETAIPWDAAFRTARRDRGRGRADHDLPDRKRDGGDDDSEPFHRADASAFSRGHAGAGRPGGRRGAARGDLYPARAAQARAAWVSPPPAGRRR